MEPLVEIVEPLAEAEGGGHRIGADEGCGAVPGSLEEGGQGLVAAVERKDHVVAHAVDGG